MNRRRVTVSPSNAPGMSRSAVYLDLASLCRSGTCASASELNAARKPIVNNETSRHETCTTSCAGTGSAAPQAARLDRPPAAERPWRPRWPRARAPQPTAIAPASQTASASSRSAAACACATSEITSASSAIASRSPSAASRDSPSAYSWSPSSSARSRSVGLDDPLRAVVQPRALEDHLEQQLVLARFAARARGPAAARWASPGGSGSAAEVDLVAEQLGDRARPRRGARRGAPRRRRSRSSRCATSANASRAAASVSSMSSSVCASDGNHASNCDGGRVHAARQQRAAPGAVRVEVARRRARRSRAPGARRRTTVSRPGTLWTLTGQPAPAAASRRPSASCSVGRLPAARRPRSSSCASVASAGGDRERVARQRPGLVDVARGRDPLHQLAPAAVRRRGQPAADDLAEDRQVGEHAVQLLGAAARDAEAGDHLVEDQQRAVLVGDRAAAPRGTRVAGGTTPMFAGTGSARIAANRVARRLGDDVGVVPRHDHGRRRGRLRDAGARRDPLRREPRARPARAARRRGRGRRRRT